VRSLLLPQLVLEKGEAWLVYDDEPKDVEEEDQVLDPVAVSPPWVQHETFLLVTARGRIISPCGS